ncbi:PLDc N-terminal domain-containing protein [Sedimentitalea sp. JM2-8]|uniref:PLDc N-terminal domain-containing protein n=1 Tax=Sedimentitalea xiamensis TaxID=3050037 RepID=A0ABT7FAK4_9RHOB|nr:PLDc N-terminal domain-containing protein [Sedimentitalea xiamensis]MDK3072005.1 PLDc N-terminal domain-containing protein [Sedimentitalea xiamensis]
MIMENGFTFWNFLVDAFIVFLFIMWIWLLIRVFGDLFRRKDVGGFGKVVWIIVLFVLPYLGVFFYLLTQGSAMHARDLEAAREAREHLRDVVGFSVADEIAKLEALKAENKITDAEYSKLRAKLV